VLVQDAGGTPVPNVAVSFTVVSGGGSVSGGNATTGANGVATVGSWTLGNTLGTNTLRAAVQADNVTGNPVTFTATSVPGAPSPNRSSVSAVPGTIAASSGTSASVVTIVVRDAKGNPIPGQAVTLSATGAGTSLSQPNPTDASGSTTGRFSATGSGAHAISATVASITVGSASVNVTPGSPVAAATTAQVPGGNAGSPTQIAVALQDQFGNPVPGAAGVITITVTGANVTGPLPVKDAGGGSYTASYTPVRTGNDQVTVLVGGAGIPGSPFLSAVVPGASDPDHTTAEFHGGTLFVPLQVVVHVADAVGNPVGHGGDQVAISVQNVADLTVTDNGDGTYSATWPPTGVGTFHVAISLNGQAIRGSPFPVRVGFF
jgi:adhesin/invasin